MSARIIFLLLLMISPAWAQGYGGLGTAAEGFAVPVRGTVLHFPEDHGPHRAFRIEWWYLTANLHGDDGADYGIQWTLFRSALAPAARPGWEDPQVWMGHAALTTAQRHFAAERFARSGIGEAGVTALPFAAWIDNWRMDGTSAQGADPLSQISVRAAGDGFSYDLHATARGPIVLQGDKGYSVKSREGQASYYYSQPFYQVSGTITVDGRQVAVTGPGWLDREWSSQPLTAGQTGWDWFSLHLDTGEKLMAYRFRDQAGDFVASTWISAEGRAESLPPGSLTLTPVESAVVAGRSVPVRWRLQLPSHGLDIETEPLNPQSWMGLQFPYWEGPIRVSGSHHGEGYLEMTGYR